MKESTEKLYPFLKNKMIRIYNPFNFERIIENLEEKVDKNLKEYYEKEPFVVSVMRLTENSKDFNTFICKV